MCNKHVFWQCLKIRESRRNGARSWQDHFHECITDAACPGRFKRTAKTASLHHSKELDVTIGINVDDGYATNTIFGEGFRIPLFEDGVEGKPTDHAWHGL